MDRAGLKIRAVGLTVANGKWLCGYTNQGMAARQADPEPDSVANAVTNTESDLVSDSTPDLNTNTVADTVAHPEPDSGPDTVANTVTYTKPDPKLSSTPSPTSSTTVQTRA